jgi:2-polyprenyl-3-methyl-5-hydroxy-6-metoxy-1,4-benzoquinol methylase
MSHFDYSKIPPGYYDDILNAKNGLRKFWHFHKFESVLRFIPAELKGSHKTILDIGCFAGSFLGMINDKTFGKQVGVDILHEQINYANLKYQTSFRHFQFYQDSGHLENLEKSSFDVITLIEVIEHLNESELMILLGSAKSLLKEHGRLIITTPNYFSTWPFLELILNLFSDVSYQEQHITKFNYFNIDPKLPKILKDDEFVMEKKTTSHFLTPFVAPFSYPLAIKMSQTIPDTLWHNPFGNIVLSSWKKNI